MADEIDVPHELAALGAEIKRLEAEYNMFFSGRLPRPPWETRGRVAAMIKRLDRARIRSTGDRFHFETLQSRYQAFVDLWDRGLRAREEGRPGPFAVQKKPAARPEAGDAKIVHVAAFQDPMREMDKLHGLYDSLMDARRAAGEDVVPFHRFAALVKDQVAKLRQSGSPEVAFRVAVKGGKVNFTVRGVKSGGS
jgi:hypothetical protein